MKNMFFILCMHKVGMASAKLSSSFGRSLKFTLHLDVVFSEQQI